VNIVDPLVHLLRLGCDLPSSAVFCSSPAGSIPNDTFFVSSIVQSLADSDLVIAIVSPT